MSTSTGSTDTDFDSGDRVSGGHVVIAVVVTYRADDDRLERCLASLDAHGGVDHVVVVDNGDLAVVGASPERTLLRSATNGGFGAGANLGFAEAHRRGADVMLLLNDDVTVTNGWLDPLLRELDAAHVGVVQPLLVFDDGVTVNSMGVTIGGDGAGNDIGLGRPVTSVDSANRPIDIFSGGVIACRSDFIDDTGGFDERFFLYYEDVDLARRGAEAGWVYRCVPSSIVLHRKGASTSQLGDRLVYLQERNRLWSAFRHEPPAIVARALWLSIRRVRHRPYLAHARGLAAGLIGAPVRLVERWSARRVARTTGG